MAQIRKLERQVEIKSPADKFYDAFRTKLQLMPKACSQLIKDVKLVQGDWDSVGSVRLWTFVCEGKSETLKETTENIDDKNKTISHKLLEGVAMNSYKNWKTIINVIPKGEGSLVKWTIEYEKLNESVPDPTIYADLYAIWANILDAYLLLNA